MTLMMGIGAGWRIRCSKFKLVEILASVLLACFQLIVMSVFVYSARVETRPQNGGQP